MPASEPEIVDFAAEDNYRSAARGGTVFTGPAPCPMARERADLLGKVVRINGALYRVKGVEGRRLPGTLAIREGEPIGLVVEPLPD